MPHGKHPRGLDRVSPEEKAQISARSIHAYNLLIELGSVPKVGAALGISGSRAHQILQRGAAWGLFEFPIPKRVYSRREILAAVREHGMLKDASKALGLRNPVLFQKAYLKAGVTQGALKRAQDAFERRRVVREFAGFRRELGRVPNTGHLLRSKRNLYVRIRKYFGGLVKFRERGFR